MVFRQLAQDVARAYPSDPEVNNEMEEAQAPGTLFPNRIDKPIRSRVMESLRAVAQPTLDGKMDGWRKENQRGHEMYRESLEELLDD